jgi:hypothetical protein
MPTVDEKELQRRASLLGEGLRRFLIACALVVKEFHRDHYGAILNAACRWATAGLGGRECNFVIKRIGGFAAFEAFFGGPLYVAAYDALEARLQPVWRERSIPASVKSPRFVRRSGRYGEAQYAGVQRRNAIIRFRAAELQAAVPVTLGPDIQLDDAAALRIARSSAGPGAAALACLAAVLKKSPSAMKVQLIAARKFLKRAAQVGRALDERGWSSVGPDGNVILSQAPRVPAGTLAR